MRNLASKLGLAVICAALLYGAPAKAWYDESGNWHSNRWHQQRVFFRDDDRAYLGHYIYAHGLNCPPGTRPHHRHCVARPGNVVYYRPGMVLPSTVVYEPLPYTVSARLAAPPPGAVYVRANNNVYLINRRDRTIIDAINLMSDIR